MKEKLLLIDDDADYRLALGRLLSVHFEVVEATTLNEGIHQALGDQYLCILLDLALPDSAWPQTFKRFSEITQAPSVIVVSGRDDPELVAASIRAGAAGYLVKGRDDVDAEHLLTAIRRAVLHKASDRGLQEAAEIAHDTAQIHKPEQP